MPNARISEKGQITLPASLRRKLGLEANTRVEISLRDDEIVIRPIKTISQLYGVFRAAAPGGKPIGWEEERLRMEQAVAREANGE